MPDFEDKLKAAFDAEFERERPRPGLRGRVIANAVATPRVQRRGFGAWLTPPRMALAGAAAAVLVVAGVGLRAATQGGPPVAVKPSATASPSVLAFGKLPAPVLHPPQGLGAGGGEGTSTIIPYFGPATMSWSGQLPKVPPSAPVYRLTAPTVADADAFAARLGATPQPPSPKDPDRVYRGPGAYDLRISLVDPVAGEPTYRIIRQRGSSPNRPFTEAAARAAADAELTRLGLMPSSNSSVQVSRLNPSSDQPLIFLVQYQRAFLLAGGVVALEVDGNGDPTGVRVIVDSAGQILEISGVLRQAEEPATYPLRAPSTVVDAAVSATPVMSGDTANAPAVALTRAALVYTTVRSGDIGYLVPAYLFTGPFQQNATLLEKRVLVPALAPRAIGAP